MDANVPSIYQQINQRADAIKANKWLTYKPLSRFQLTDYDAAADDETDPSYITLIAMTADQNPDKTSTRRTSVQYKQFKVIKRSTELLAIRNANCPPDEAPVIRKASEERRWCILCGDRHPIDDFIRRPEPDFKRQSIKEFMHNKQYLHGISYACRDKLLAGYHGRRWKISA